MSRSGRVRASPTSHPSPGPHQNTGLRLRFPRDTKHPHFSYREPTQSSDSEADGESDSDAQSTLSDVENAVNYRVVRAKMTPIPSNSSTVAPRSNANAFHHHKRRASGQMYGRNYRHHPIGFSAGVSRLASNSSIVMKAGGLGISEESSDTENDEKTVSNSIVMDHLSMHTDSPKNKGKGRASRLASNSSIGTTTGNRHSIDEEPTDTEEDEKNVSNSIIMDTDSNTMGTPSIAMEFPSPTQSKGKGRALPRSLNVPSSRRLTRYRQGYATSSPEPMSSEGESDIDSPLRQRFPSRFSLAGPSQPRGSRAAGDQAYSDDNDDYVVVTVGSTRVKIKGNPQTVMATLAAQFGLVIVPNEASIPATSAARLPDEANVDAATEVHFIDEHAQDTSPSKQFSSKWMSSSTPIANSPPPTVAPRTPMRKRKAQEDIVEDMVVTPFSPMVIDEAPEFDDLVHASPSLPVQSWLAPQRKADDNKPLAPVSSARRRGPSEFSKLLDRVRPVPAGQLGTPPKHDVLRINSVVTGAQWAEEADKRRVAKRVREGYLKWKNKWDEHRGNAHWATLSPAARCNPDSHDVDMLDVELVEHESLRGGQKRPTPEPGFTRHTDDESMDRLARRAALRQEEMAEYANSVERTLAQNRADRRAAAVRAAEKVERIRAAIMAANRAREEMEALQRLEEDQRRAQEIEQARAAEAQQFANAWSARRQLQLRTGGIPAKAHRTHQRHTVIPSANHHIAPLHVIRTANGHVTQPHPYTRPAQRDRSLLDYLHRGRSPPPEMPGEPERAMDPVQPAQPAPVAFTAAVSTSAAAARRELELQHRAQAPPPDMLVEPERAVELVQPAEPAPVASTTAISTSAAVAAEPVADGPQSPAPRYEFPFEPIIRSAPPPHLRRRVPGPTPSTPSLPTYTVNRYSRNSPSPPPPYNALAVMTAQMIPAVFQPDPDAPVEQWPQHQAPLHLLGQVLDEVDNDSQAPFMAPAVQQALAQADAVDQPGIVATIGSLATRVGGFFFRGWSS